MAQSTLPPLQEYLHLRSQAAELEDHTTEACEPRDFARCPWCEQARDLQIRQRQLMELHGESWAVLLSQRAAHDQAAHTGMLVLQVVLGFWEAQDFETSRHQLQDALDLYREADRRMKGDQ
jgi:hypothetical protein